jgi:hypothetical protein
MTSTPLLLLLLLLLVSYLLQELESFTDDADGSAAAAESDDLDDFGLSGWGQFGSEEAVPEQSAGKRTGRSKATKVSQGICRSRRGNLGSLWELLGSNGWLSLHLCCLRLAWEMHRRCCGRRHPAHRALLAAATERNLVRTPLTPSASLLRRLPAPSVIHALSPHRVLCHQLLTMTMQRLSWRCCGTSATKTTGVSRPSPTRVSAHWAGSWVVGAGL